MCTGSKPSLPALGFGFHQQCRAQGCGRKVFIHLIFLSCYKLKVDVLYVRVIARGVANSDFIQKVHCFWSVLFFALLCHSVPLLPLSFPSLARGSVNLLFSTKLSGKWGRKASICLPPPSSLLRPFLTTLHATHPYTMWRNKLHFFCVRKEQKCIWL